MPQPPTVFVNHLLMTLLSSTLKMMRIFPPSAEDYKRRLIFSFFKTSSNFREIVTFSIVGQQNVFTEPVATRYKQGVNQQEPLL